MTNTDYSTRPGIYNVDYFSGSQLAIYIGDTWVDEVTSITYSVSQNRVPLYGYADQLFQQVSKGQVLVQGEFTINFKEAGYLFLVLDRFQWIMNGKASVMNAGVSHSANPPGVKHNTAFTGSAGVAGQTIESIINNDSRLSEFQTNEVLKSLAEGLDAQEQGEAVDRAETSASLGGFSSVTRSVGGIGEAENIFETFEDAIWGKTSKELENLTRRADDPKLNPFDIFLAFGDFAGDNNMNHTIQKLEDVHIVGTARQIVIDGQPIQESYSFIAKNLI